MDEELERFEKKIKDIWYRVAPCSVLEIEPIYCNYQVYIYIRWGYKGQCYGMRQVYPYNCIYDERVFNCIIESLYNEYTQSIIKKEIE